MHELTLAQGIVDIVTDHARRDGCAHVRVVHVELGALAQVMPEALLFSFDAASRGTRAEGARIKLHHVAGKAWCAACAAGVEVESRMDVCPRCSGVELVVTGGSEMRVTELEVE